MLKEAPKASGELKIVLRDENGNIKDERRVKNLIVNSGLEYIVSRMKDATATAMSHMEVGTGSTAAAASDTALGAAVSGARVALDSTTIPDGTPDDDLVYVATFGAGTGTDALTEAGIFNAASAGTMLCRTVFSAVNKGANDSLEITWTISLSAS